MPSKSKQQQKFMGMVHALQKGDMKPSDASQSVKDAAKSMSKKDAKDFASTSHKGLPKKVKQEIARKLREYANKMGTNTMGGDSIPSAKKGGLRDFDGYDNVDYNKDMPMDEVSSADAYKISRMLGTAQQSTQDFIDDNKIDVKKLESYIKKLSPSKKIIIKDIVNGSTDKRLSTIKKGLIKQVKESIEENFPSNWLQGRVSDYHTKKGTTKRDDYDDTNFNTKHSGQEDLEDEESVNESSDINSLKKIHDGIFKFLKTKKGVGEVKEFSEFPNRYGDNVSTFSVKYNIEDKYNYDLQEIKIEYSASRVFIPNKGYFSFKTFNDIKTIINKKSSLNEGDLEDTIHQVKKFDKPKDEKLLTIKVINKLKDKRNKSKSTSNKEKLQQMIDKIEGEYKKGKYIKEYGAISHGYHLEPSQEDKLDGTPEDKMAIDEVGVFPIRAFLDDMIPGNLIKTTNPKDKERLKSTIKDLIFTLNRFWKQHNIPYRVREK